MKTVGCKGSDANFYGLSNTLGNGNLSTNSFRMESDNIFTIRTVFAKRVVLPGSHLPMQWARSPSAQSGRCFSVSGEPSLGRDLCPWCGAGTPSSPRRCARAGRERCSPAAPAKHNTPGPGRPGARQPAQAAYEEPAATLAHTNLPSVPPAISL